MEIQIFTWMMDIFFIFTLHILYSQVLGVKVKNKLLFVLGWCGCFVAWNVGSYTSNEHPFINGMCSLVINFFIVLFLYEGSIRTKAVLVFMVVVFGVISEMLVGFLLTMVNCVGSGREGSEKSSFYLASALSKIVCFIIVKAVAYLSKKEKQIKVGFVEWLEIFVIPVGSLIVFYVVASDDYHNVTIGKTIVFTVLLVINLLSYYMYQKMQANIEQLMNTEMIRQQNEYYRMRCENVEQQWKMLRRIRHDMSNHYILELGYLEAMEYEKLRELYKERIGVLKRSADIINTGNIGIDSALNYKEEIAHEAKIQVKRDIRTRGEINISSGDINVLLGNLMDNAIEAVSFLGEEQRVIHYKLFSDDTAFLFEIQNAYNGELHHDKENELITGKQDKENHGIGLKNVKEIVKKYNGVFEVNMENQTFQVKTFLYYPELEG